MFSCILGMRWYSGFAKIPYAYMPITKSAKKALRQSVRRRQRNVLVQRKIKDVLKKVRGLLVQKKFEEAKEFLPQVSQVLDKAAKAGVIKKNTASRKKSRIAKLFLKNIT